MGFAYMQCGTAGYTHEVLSAAQAYAEHAQRPPNPAAGGGSSANANGIQLELDDLRLAVSSQLEHSYSTALPKEFLLPLATQINRVPLPILPESYGIRLPPERERLTAPNWDFLPVTERRAYAEQVPQQQQDLVQLMPDGQYQLNGDGTAALAGLVNGAGDMQNLVKAGRSNGMDIDPSAQQDLFGRPDEDADGVDEEDDEDDDDDDDDDDEEMEDVLEASLQNGVAKPAEPDGDDDADGDGDGDGEADADGDGEGDAEGSRREDDDYDAE